MLTYVDDDASNNEANKADNISKEVPNSSSFTSNSRSSSSSIEESSKYRLDTVNRNNQYVKNIEDFAGCYSKWHLVSNLRAHLNVLSQTGYTLTIKN